MSEEIEKQIFFLRTHSNFLRNGASAFFPWDLSLLRKYKDVLNWDGVAGNPNMEWDYGVFYEFADQLAEGLNIMSLCGNEDVPWTVDLINEFYGIWSWELLAQNPAITGNEELRKTFYKDLKPFLDSIDRDEISFGEHQVQVLEKESKGLQKHLECRYTKWSEVEESSTINWSLLSHNELLPWSFEKLDQYKEKFDWDVLSSNSSIAWNMQLLEAFENRLHWGEKTKDKSGRAYRGGGICMINGLLWTEAMIDRFHNKVDFDNLQVFGKVDWNLELIIRHWKNIERDNGFLMPNMWERVTEGLEAKVVLNLLDELVYTRHVLLGYC